MSKLILSQLQPIKPLIKSKGLDFEIFGCVKNGSLYINNGFIEIETPIDIPFDCCINLHQLYTILSSNKKESVVVNVDDKVYIVVDDLKYEVDSENVNFLEEHLHIFNATPQYQCDRPQVFKTMMNIAEHIIVQNESDVYVDYIKESLLIKDNIVLCCNKSNIFEGNLDFAMPNLALSLAQIVWFNKIAKSKEIIAMDIVGEHLLIMLDCHTKIYMKCLHHINLEKFEYAHQSIIKAINKHWVNPNIEISEIAVKQINLLHKLNSQNVIYFTNSFCQSETQQINYPQFTDEVFNFKCFYKVLKLVLTYSRRFHIGKIGMSYINVENNIRGFSSRIIED